MSGGPWEPRGVVYLCSMNTPGSIIVSISGQAKEFVRWRGSMDCSIMDRDAWTTRVLTRVLFLSVAPSQDAERRVFRGVQQERAEALVHQVGEVPLQVRLIAVMRLGTQQGFMEKGG